MFSMRFRDILPQAVVDEFESAFAQLSAIISKEHNEDGTHRVSIVPEAVPVGGTIMWVSNTIPARWLVCDGAQVSRATYRTLFDVIGVTYGVGDGVSTFNLPDFRQRFPIGKAASGTASVLGDDGGEIDHEHGLSGGSVSGTTGANGGHGHSASGNVTGDGAHTHNSLSGNTGFSNDNIEVQAGTGADVASDAHTHNAGNIAVDSGGGHSHSVSVSVDSTGDHTHSFSASLSGGGTDDNNPPFLVVNFIILAGV